MRTRSRFFVRLVTLALTVSAPVACYQRGAKQRNPFAAPGSERGKESIRVRVENQNFNDATIHAIRGGERIRLGQVTGKTESTFTLPWTFSLPLQFQVHLNGGADCNVRAISVDPGDEIWVRIPIEVDMSPCYAGKG